MLDSSILEQLKSVFADLSESIELLYEQGDDVGTKELVDLLEAVASTSPKIQVRAIATGKPLPYFGIALKGTQPRIQFQAIPGGHEFTSLIVALLNLAGRGKLPEQRLAERIRNINLPAQLTTVMSLTCENCPEVVQVLNQFSILNDKFHHLVVDGGVAPELVNELGVQGVPSIYFGKELIHSGRASFTELLEKLETRFGKIDQNITEQKTDLGHYDVLVLGAGPAGAAAAIYSARKGLKTAIVADKIGGQVQETKGIENFISIPYTEGPQMAANLYKHLEAYDIKIFDRRRIEKLEAERSAQLSGGERISGDAVIVATGAQWRKLGVRGEVEYLGRGVAYCPHCDGPFYKEKDIIVVGGGNSGVEAAIDLAGIARSVTLLEYGGRLRADQILQDKLLSLKSTKVITAAKTLELVGDGNKLTSLKYEDLKTKEIKALSVDGVFIQIGLVPNSQLVKGVLECSEFGEIKIDEKCRTSVAQIYAAGDVTTVPFKQIVIAMGEGAKASLSAFEDRLRQTVR